MQSMTGFGNADQDYEGRRLTVQIATVNHRSSRVTVRSELRDLALEDQVRKRVQQGLERGSITVQIGLVAADDADWDAAELSRRWRSLAKLAHELGAPAPRLEEVLRLQGRSQIDADPRLAEAVLQTVDAAIAACQAMRQTEGASLADTFRQRRQRLAELRQAFTAAAAGRMAKHQARLEERLVDLLRDRAGVSDEVIVREMAVYADRIDIDEELDRLDSHLQQLGELIDQESGQGKRMEFLLQEIGRELNTTGSKANDAELQKLVVEGKTVLEQMREQVANVL